MILPIVKEPQPILRRKATPVGEITAEVRKLIGDMIETMHAAEGVGLAANQVGSPLNVLIACPNAQEGRGKEIVLLNAVLSKRRGRNRSPEGCLSVPGVAAEVTRSSEVTATGLDREGKPAVIEARGLLAKILQHETDHLAGKLYVDHLTPWKRADLLAKYKEISDALKDVQL